MSKTPEEICLSCGEVGGEHVEAWGGLVFADRFIGFGAHGCSLCYTDKRLSNWLVGRKIDTTCSLPSIALAAELVAKEQAERAFLCYFNDALDNPEMDCTDAAHPAWWRGNSGGVKAFCQRITRTLEGKDDGTGVMGGEECETFRRALLDLVSDRAKLAASVKHIQDWIHLGEEEKDYGLLITKFGRNVCEWLTDFTDNLSDRYDLLSKENEDLRNQLAQHRKAMRQGQASERFPAPGE